MAKFSAPWTAAHHPGSGYVVRDATRRVMLQVYYLDDPVLNQGKLTRAEAERLADWIASSPERFANMARGTANQ